MTEVATGTLLRDLMDPQALNEAIEAGHVKCQSHPEQPLLIYNYTERCQYERAWSEVTRQCRGLIVHAATGRVVARPFPKFFNYGEHARAVWERIGDGETAADICAALPDEFHAWVREVAAELLAGRDRIISEAAGEHERITASLPEGWTRKDYALIAGKSPLRAWLFLLLDGRDPSERIWRTLKPPAERSLISHGEDVA